MSKKELNHAEYMSLQLMEIESFRLSLTHPGQEKISFNEAAMLWISKGHADKFRAGRNDKRRKVQPAQA